MQLHLGQNVASPLLLASDAHSDVTVLKNNKIKVPITNNTTYLDNDLKKQDIDILVNSFLNDKEGFYNLDISYQNITQT